MVNTSQQVGGSLGVALLSTVFADAVSGFTAATGTPAALRRPRPLCTATHASGGPRHPGAGAIVTALLFERGHMPAAARACRRWAA